jgi:ABC-type glutathione transport system ATPase component
MLTLRELVVTYPGQPPVTAVAGIDLEVERGTTVSLVGESGSGKSTVARAVTAITPVSAGRVLLDGAEVTNPTGRKLRELRRRVQLVFQDPRASLNPRMTVGRALREAAATAAGGRIDSAAGAAEMERLLELVELPAPLAERYPHELSGGQLQRIAIARALATKPELLLLDEVTASLDVSVQATILNLLRDLRAELGLTCLYISHDLSIVRYISDRVYVMERGAIVESGPVDEVYSTPRSLYTQRLLAAVPHLGGGRWRRRERPAPVSGSAS